MNFVLENQAAECAICTMFCFPRCVNVKPNAGSIQPASLGFPTSIRIPVLYWLGWPWKWHLRISKRYQVQGVCWLKKKKKKNTLCKIWTQSNLKRSGAKRLKIVFLENRQITHSQGWTCMNHRGLISSEKKIVSGQIAYDEFDVKILHLFFIGVEMKTFSAPCV